MTPSPSEAILRWFRDTLKAKDMNTAALANKVGAKRASVRNVLAGREPLTVDQLVLWGQALELKLEDLVGVDMPELPEEPEASEEVDAEDIAGAMGPTLLRAAPEEPSDKYEVDPYGLQGEQAVRFAFAMGVDFAFVVDSSQLADSGVPEATVKANPKRLLIKLDAAFHRHNAPEFTDDELIVVLSFDALYTCTFPWSAVVQVVYFIEPPPPTTKKRDDPPEPPENGGRPMLRLVK